MLRDVSSELMAALRKRAEKVGTSKDDVALDMIWVGLAVTAPEPDEPAQETQLRAWAEQLGYRLEKDPGEDQLSRDVGGYRLVTEAGLIVLGGSRPTFSASAVDVRSFLRAEEKRRE